MCFPLFGSLLLSSVSRLIVAFTWSYPIGVPGPAGTPRWIWTPQPLDLRSAALYGRENHFFANLKV